MPPLLASAPSLQLLWRRHCADTMPSPEQTKWRATSQKWGALKFAYKNWSSYFVRLQLCAISISSFHLRPIIAWKIYLHQWSHQTYNQDFTKRGKPKTFFFFAQELPDLAPMLNKMMQLKHVTNGHVTKYLVSVDGGLGAEPPAAG